MFPVRLVGKMGDEVRGTGKGAAVARGVGCERFVAAFGVAALGGAAAAWSRLRCAAEARRLWVSNRELDRLSRSDLLTGLFNRRHLEDALSGAASVARRHGQPLSVLFIDIDDFKRINDGFGYDVGDQVLRVVAQRIRACTRAEDVVGRWGGEEFVAVAPMTALDGAVALGERIRAGIEARSLSAAGRAVTVTVSVGCAPVGAAGPDEALRAAGRALQGAKQQGRNAVVAAGSGGPVAPVRSPGGQLGREISLTEPDKQDQPGAGGPAYTVG